MPDSPDDFDLTARTVPSWPGRESERPPVGNANGRLVGRTIGGFLVKARLGGGGMGEVYLAEQDLGAGTKLVALKTIRANYLTQDEAIKRFQEEAFAAGTMKTRYVVQVMSYGKVDEDRGMPLHYLVMEYCSAGTLTDYMMTFKDRRLPIDEGIRLLRQAAEGFLAAERRIGVDGRPDPLVHRDIKPANLLVQRTDTTDEVEIRIADFGTVKRHRRGQGGIDTTALTQGGAPMTPGYASPEQWNWEQVDLRSDMYSLGATFYHVLTGHRATPDTNELGLIHKFVMQAACLSPKAVIDNCPETLNRVIMKMTARQPGDRYASFADVIEELAVFEQPKVSQKKVWITAAMAVAVLATVSMIFGASRSVTASALRSSYEDLRARTSETLKDPALTQLAGLNQQLLTIQKGIDEEMAKLQRSIDAGGDEATAPFDLLEQSVRLRDRHVTLAARLKQSRDALAQLGELETACEQTLSCDDALARLAAIAVPDGVPTLAEVKQGLGVRIEDLHEQRKAELGELSASLLAVGRAQLANASMQRSSADRFIALRQRVSAFRQRVGRVEPALDREAQALSAAIDGAADLERMLPVWPPAGTESPRAQLRALVAALATIGVVEEPGATLLADWWQLRRRDLARAWLPSVLQALSMALQEQDALMTKLQGLDRDAAKELLNASVRPDWEDLDELLRQVNRALEGNTGAGVFDAKEQLQIGRLAKTPERPTLDYSVAALRADYDLIKQVASNFKMDVERLVTGDEEAKRIAGQAADEAGRVFVDAAAALKALDAERRLRIADLDGLQPPRTLDQRLSFVVRDYLGHLRQRFSRDALPMSLNEVRASLARWTNEFAPWDKDCQALADMLGDSVASAIELTALASLPGMSGATLADQAKAFDQSKESIQTVCNTQTDKPDLAEWQQAWGRNRLKELVDPIVAKLKEPSADLNDLIEGLLTKVDAIRQIDAELAESLRGALRNAQSMIQQGAAPSKPEAWSDEAWDHWPKGIVVPEGLQAEWRNGTLVCSFPFRERIVDLVTEVRRPVEMVLVVPPGAPADPPFLVDRHEVCVGELLALDVGLRNDPGGYYKWHRQSQWTKIRYSPDALVSWTSFDIANGFAQTAYAGKIVFELPSREQWQLLRGDAPDRAPSVESDPAKVRINPADEVNNVFGLRSGLAEWRANGTFAGPSDFEARSLENAGALKRDTLVMGAGFRCVYTLLMFNPR